MSREKPPNPRRMRVSRRATNATDSTDHALDGDGLRLRLRLSPADACLLEALRGEDEDDAQVIRRLIRTAGLNQAVLDRLDAIEGRMDGLAIAPAPTPEELDAPQPETDDVTRQKQAVAGYLASLDDEDE